MYGLGGGLVLSAGKGRGMKRLDKIMSKAAAMADDAKREGLAPAIRRFRQEEDGSLLIFGLFCLIIMMMMSGLALDLMRDEERRTTLSNTTDRAVLAAANLSQTLPPKDVVKDYFIKAGLTPPLDSEITVVQGQFNESRTVTATVAEKVPSWFITAFGIPYMDAKANGTAQQKIGQVEISLVLDISGSMDANNKIGNLRVAAKDFVDTMFNAVEPGKLSINIVTYSTQVSAGPQLMAYFNATAEQTDSYCLEFEPAKNDFDRLSFDFGFLPANRVYQRNAHFDPFNTTATTADWNCQPARNRDIIAFSGDQVALKAYIDGLTADGNTSINLGMKWGAGLLDPSMSGVVDDMISHNKIPAAFADRPYAYSNRDALKVVVLMTDGSNTTDWRVKSPYMSGNSLLMTNNSFAANSTSLAQYSLWDPVKGQYYIFAKSTWRAQPYGDGSFTTCNKYGVCTTTQDPGDSVQMTWQEVWKKMPINYFSDKIIKTAGAAGGSENYSNWRSSANPGKATEAFATNKDAQTLTLCTEAKNKRVSIFTIGFEAPTAGKNLLKSCASSPATFYDVAGLQISTAFAAIASSINKLRLTQ